MDRWVAGESCGSYVWVDKTEKEYTVVYANIYHATRKTSSIVKSALDPQSSVVGLKLPYLSSSQRLSWVLGDGWSPFNGSDGTALLGQLDVAFLAVSAFGMYFSGHLGDRVNLRMFLMVEMVGTGLLTTLFGAGYWANIHSFYYYLIVQMVAGLFQLTGWPSVVAVVGNWCGKKKRGIVMGIWNSHTSIGNIIGSLIDSIVLSYRWGWSFVVPGLIIAFMGVVVSLLLPETAVRFMEAWRIPGVAPFALCLFFAKLVAYTFLYWLPCYSSHTEIEGKYLSDETAGNLSTFFHVGGVLGGILAGHISDCLDGRAITAATFIRPGNAQFIEEEFQGIGNRDGDHRWNGSVGAAIGPLLTGYISANSWSAVFTMLMGAALVAGLLLTRLVVAKVAARISEPRSEGRSQSRCQDPELNV
ncbi:putative glycerol-3-phosphate transporter 1 [Hibiscus syriacus]|uniref:Glycerol-3-phosphate transporter 1 n=1 Tax=Hibiscus syriacus TaxID=106335 RepID=A0A6A2YQ28_HIBSY|nr:putative glycerol-3-phosphate transporter 1 [Hibiscus syriacus]